MQSSLIIVFVENLLSSKPLPEAVVTYFQSARISFQMMIDINIKYNIDNKQ